MTYLPNGNLVVIDPGYDIPGGAQNVGSLWIYRPDGSVLSQLTGAFASDQLGNSDAVRTGNKVWLLTGSKFLVRSDWDARRGSVTWIDGDVGLNGVVSAQNSLVGASPADSVGTQVMDRGRYRLGSALTDGNLRRGVGVPELNIIGIVKNAALFGCARCARVDTHPLDKSDPKLRPI